MEITIKGAKNAPSWETLQSMLIQATGAEPGSKLTRINRVDRGVDYGAPGVYELTFLRYGPVQVPYLSEAILVKLTVER